jgi:hypothetical protein
LGEDEEQGGDGGEMEEGVEGSGGGGLGRKIPAGEVELKEKSGTAWSHSFLNQKPWHPLSYPNQRRKWIAEQIHTNRARRDEEVQRELAQEQEFFRQTALFSKKDKEKVCIYKDAVLLFYTSQLLMDTSLNYCDCHSGSLGVMVSWFCSLWFRLSCA